MSKNISTPSHLRRPVMRGLEEDDSKCGTNDLEYMNSSNATQNKSSGRGDLWDGTQPTFATSTGAMRMSAT